MYSYSTSTVQVEKNGTFQRNLFAEPRGFSQYLQAKPSHSFHTMKALPKSQFTGFVLSHQNIGNMQIYSQTYKRPALMKIATEISKTGGGTLLEYKHKEKSK